MISPGIMTLPNTLSARLFTALRDPRLLVRFALIVAAYLCAFIVLDFLARAFEELPGVVAWYPAAGLGFALLLVFGARFAPALAIASLISSFLIYRLSQPPEALLLWAFLLSLIYGVAAALLRHRLRFDWRLRRLRDVTYLVFATVLVSAPLAVLSVSGSSLGGDMPRSDAFAAIFDWWIGETVGVLTITPFLLVFVMPWLKRFAEGRRFVLPARRSFPRPTLSVIGQGVSLALTLYWVFGAPVSGEFRPLYLLTLPLIWIALQRGLKGVTAAIVVLNAGVILAIWLFGFDLARLSELELLMIGNCVVGLTMGAVVTERRRAEEALGDKQRLLTESQQVAQLGSWAIELPSFQMTWSEQNYLNFGLSSDAPVPSFESYLGLLHPDDRVAMREWKRACLAKESPDSLEFRSIRPDGTLRVFEGQGRLIRDDENRPVRMVGTVQDITERRRAEEALKQSEEQLRQSQKMEAVGQLAGGIAHDFNNLLTAILGYSDMILASEAASFEEVRPDIEEIKHAGERASALTQQILAFSRRQALRPTVVSLNEVLAGMEPLLRRTLGEDIDLLSLKDPDLGSVEADVHQFEQVLMNLAVNARDAMVPGGRLTLETANADLDEEYCRTHPEVTPGSYVMLAVSDTGAGMDEATLEHIFEPFFTTKAPGAGTGLGLATVHGIVRQSNGSISVYSEPGKGTSFKIYLPRVTAAVQEESLVATGTGAQAGRRDHPGRGRRSLPAEPGHPRP